MSVSSAWKKPGAVTWSRQATTKAPVELMATAGWSSRRVELATTIGPPTALPLPSNRWATMSVSLPLNSRTETVTEPLLVTRPKMSKLAKLALTGEKDINAFSSKPSRPRRVRAGRRGRDGPGSSRRRRANMTGAPFGLGDRTMPTRTGRPCPPERGAPRSVTRKWKVGSGAE
jgi:hypothetical protein